MFLLPFIFSSKEHVNFLPHRQTNGHEVPNLFHVQVSRLSSYHNDSVLNQPASPPIHQNPNPTLLTPTKWTQNELISIERKNLILEDSLLNQIFYKSRQFNEPKNGFFIGLLQLYNSWYCRNKLASHAKKLSQTCFALWHWILRFNNETAIILNRLGIGWTQV